MRPLHISTFLLICCSLARSEVVLYPPDLDPGDRYRIAFVTSATRAATATNIGEYNRFVQSVADAAPELGQWGLEWKVIGSTRTVHANDNLGYRDDPVFVYRVDGTEATNLTREPFFFEPDFFSDGFAIRLSETGEELIGDEFGSGVKVWSGTVPSEGNGSDQFFLGADRVRWGRSSDSSGNMFSRSTAPATEENHFYAMSEVLTIPIPEPSGVMLGFAGMAMLLVVRRRR